MIRFTMLVILGLVFLRFGASNLTAMSDPFLNEKVIAVQKLHDQSASGDKGATDLLITTLETLLSQEPGNAIYKVYLGSAWTLKSRDVLPGPSKLRYLKDGLKTMDQAVSQTPQDPCVRFIRAVNNYHLPAFINRRDNAREDFEILIKQIQTNPSGLDGRTIQAIHYFAGLAYKQTARPEMAREVWRRGVALRSDAALTEKMNRELARLDS
ncbi:MAG: hypothetical protein ACFCUX_02810 [Candidatus Methylacidiphilales bacterium]